MEGLTNSQQAVLLMIASVLIAVGSITISLDLENPWVGIVLTIIGAVGFGLKEALGGKTSSAAT